MARQARPKEPLPPALPPETRPVGQLIAESIKLYGRRFWPSLALGLPIGIFGAVARAFDGWTYAIFSVTVGALLLTLTYVGAAVIAAERPIPRRRLFVAFAAGIVVFLPFPVLVQLYILPAVAWFALVGLAVPAAVIEGTGFVASLKRGFQLGRADYVHSLGTMAALGILFYLSTRVLAVALNARQRSGGRDRAAALRGSCSGRSSCSARASSTSTRPPGRVGPSAIEEEPRCRPTSCSRA